MKPVKFKECNVVYAEGQDEYNSLPCLKDDKGDVVICQQMTLRERLRVLVTGKVWLHLMTFNKPLTPHYMTTNKDELIQKPI
jgi:hypothetical protein